MALWLLWRNPPTDNSRNGRDSIRHLVRRHRDDDSRDSSYLVNPLQGPFEKRMEISKTALASLRPLGDHPSFVGILSVMDKAWIHTSISGFNMAGGCRHHRYNNCKIVQ